jgi:hypothetical protein
MSSSVLSGRPTTAPGGLSYGVAVMLMWIPLFVLGMVVHESFHAAAVLLLGSHPVLVLRPWAFAILPITITGVHVQPIPALAAPGQLLDNLAGPGLAAIVFGIVALKLPDGVVRRATIATVLGLVFYALIEPADVVFDGRLELNFLTTPEFNYGVPLLLAVEVAVTSAVGGRSGASRHNG